MNPNSKEAMRKPFNTQISSGTAIFGWTYLPIHGALLQIILIAIVHLTGWKVEAVYLTLIVYTIGIVCSLTFGWRFLKSNFADFQSNVTQSLMSAAAALGLYYASNVVIVLVITALGITLNNPNQVEVAAQTSANINIMLISAGLFAPIVEEMIFRGAIFGTLRRRNRALAYIVSALLFSLLHVWSYALAYHDVRVLINAVSYIAPAFALAWCYERSGNIWSPIFMHMAVNVISTLASNALQG
ncbi:MAG: CPBP family intramembrane metalloprotease [Oscillospiraceae bacterium]|jgi:membrane protease YdiL (CAAX protease family)|nr:CPBP family intramembrane metalloprotease [Oscillospiraceae bacterium]